MSKTKLLLDVVSDLHSLADSVQAIADVIAGGAPENGESQDISDTAVETTAKTVTQEQVRAVLAEKSCDGYTAEVRALLEKHGAKKLSEISPDRYAALLTDAEALQ